MDAIDPIDPSVELAPDDDIDIPKPGIGLCLSGGGYRAMLFHLGTLWRLNDAGYLPRLNRVSSVSGGSIIAGVLALVWPKLAFDDAGIGHAFQSEVAAPVHTLASKTIDVGAVLRSLFGFGRASDWIIRAYRKHLFGDHTLQDLRHENGPRFVFNAANLQSGRLWRFSKAYARDYRVGAIAQPNISLAKAVAASSAFPPFLSPVVLRFRSEQFTPNTGQDLQLPAYTTRVFLTDGGVYDNLGLETVWKRFSTVLVSDGGGQIQAEQRPSGFWPLHAFRVLNMIDNQVRSLRQRQLIASYQLPPGHRDHRAGAYWGIRTDISEYELSDALACPLHKTISLAETPTRLAGLKPVLQQRIVNWGFAVCDAAMRRYVDSSIATPPGFPYPAAGIG